MPSAVQQHFDNFRKDLNKRLHTENAVTNLLAKIEKKTGIDRSFMVLGIVGLFALYLIFGYYAEFVCNVIGLACVVYASLRAIGPHTKQTTRGLMSTFWFVFALWYLADYIFVRFPVYWIVKCGIVLYLYLPFTRGAQKLFHKFVRPVAMFEEIMELFGKFSDTVKNENQNPSMGIPATPPKAGSFRPVSPVPPIPGASNTNKCGLLQCDPESAKDVLNNVDHNKEN